MKRNIWNTAISVGIFTRTLLTLTLVSCATRLPLNESHKSTPTQNPTSTTRPSTPSEGPNSTEKILIMDQFNYYLINLDGSGRSLLYSGGDQIKMASLSPDATKFAYFMGNYVYIQDIKSGHTFTLNHEIIGSMGGQIRWSPDGTHLALECAYSQQQSPAICLIDTHNGQIQVLVNEKNTDRMCSASGAFIMFQDWSQDGSTMVYTCFILQPNDQKQDFSIFLYDLASKTSKIVFDGTPQDGIWGMGSVSISPDKETLLVTGNHKDHIVNVFLLDISNITLKQLTNDTDYDSEALVWTADSQSFYLHKTYRQIPWPESNFIMDIHGRILNSMKSAGRVLN
jgi:Tol biopolymer transport system component